MQITYDVFPAQVLVCPAPEDNQYEAYSALTVLDGKQIKHSRKVEAVRVVLYGGNVLIAGDGQNGPMLIFKEGYNVETLDLTTERNKGTSRLVTTSGKVVIFSKDNNCGCGSMLRAWNPYGTLYSVKDPTE